ncbi:MAG: hypothetical protein ACM3KM_03015 [Acidobacteriaceae bacterium]
MNKEIEIKCKSCGAVLLMLAYYIPASVFYKCGNCEHEDVVHLPHQMFVTVANPAGSVITIVSASPSPSPSPSLPPEGTN